MQSILQHDRTFPTLKMFDHNVSCTYIKTSLVFLIYEFIMFFNFILCVTINLNVQVMFIRTVSILILVPLLAI